MCNDDNEMLSSIVFQTRSKYDLEPAKVRLGILMTVSTCLLYGHVQRIVTLSLPLFDYPHYPSSINLTSSLRWSSFNYHILETLISIPHMYIIHKHSDNAIIPKKYTLGL